MARSSAVKRGALAGISVCCVFAGMLSGVLMDVAFFLIPLLLGIAIVTDFRECSKLFMQPSRRSAKEGPAGVHLLAGWVFIVLSAVPLLSALIRFLVG
ncbi:hypothetical protein [Kitasatospora sp. NPDC092286]|uniref:hypothetical protein n=1 Tax=Kitasatospora sp. NPDC092286 TaxID=3364087 RepID=UPI0037FA07FD